MEIDLHGTKHSQVRTKLDRFIWVCMQNNVICANIITGNSEKMKKLVAQVLKEYKLDHSIGSPLNQGYISVNFL